MFAKVVVDVKSTHLDETFDYDIPTDLEAYVFIGSRVLVSFGLRDMLGYVVDLVEDSPYQENAKAIKEVFSFEKELTDDQVALAKELSVDLMAPLVSTLSLMMPSFLKEQKRQTIHVEDYQALHPDLALLFQGKKKLLMNKALESSMSLIRQEIKKGTLTMGYEFYSYGVRKRVKVYHVTTKDTPSSSLRASILDYLRDHPESTEEVLVAMIPTSVRFLRKMAQERLIAYQEKVILPQEETPQVLYNSHFEFDQTQLVDKYFESDKKPFLLFSNDETFKGKFYLKMIESNLAHQQMSVFIVPNILGAEELSTFIREHTQGVRLYTYHSKNSYSDNFEAYMSLKTNQCDIIVTTPMGVFLPFSNVGCFVVSEEESTDYCYENFPYYDARKVIRKRFDVLGGKLVFASSTPSIDTYYQAMQNQLYLLDDHSLASTRGTLIDMREELLETNQSVLSEKLLEEVGLALKEQKISLLIVNQKAFSSMIRCRECGAILRCPKCNIPLAVYESKGIAQCHYCGYKTEKYHQCSCGSNQMIASGFGIEQVASKVAMAFPKARILSLALDEQKSSDDYNQYLNALEEGTMDIVIGTNALTKSLHYDNIKVVALLYADSFLNMNDHRGAEFTYDLIAKVSSREVVIVQTYAPDHYAIECALSNDYERFYQLEIKNRELMNYNPFVEINRIIMSGSKENFHFGYYFRKAAQHIPGTVILGPSYDYRARGVKILIKHNQYETVRKVFRDALKHFKDPDLRVSFQRYPKGM